MMINPGMEHQRKVLLIMFIMTWTPMDIELRLQVGKSGTKWITFGVMVLSAISPTLRIE